jgi:hypothetical protein
VLWEDLLVLRHRPQRAAHRVARNRQVQVERPTVGRELGRAGLPRPRSGQCRRWLWRQSAGCRVARGDAAGQGTAGAPVVDGEGAQVLHRQCDGDSPRRLRAGRAAPAAGAGDRGASVAAPQPRPRLDRRRGGGQRDPVRRLLRPVAQRCHSGRLVERDRDDLRARHDRSRRVRPQIPRRRRPDGAGRGRASADRAPATVRYRRCRGRDRLAFAPPADLAPRGRRAHLRTAAGADTAEGAAVRGHR